MVEHDLKIPITMDDLNELYEQTPELTLFITVQGKKYEYTTKLKRHSFGKMDYQFFDTNKDKFFSIYVKNGITEVDIDLVHKSVLRIGSLTPLETVFYLSTWFCTMVDITDIKLIDAAHSVCKDDEEHKNEYPLKIYRLLATDLPAPAISIYSKFFQYRKVPILDETDITYVAYIRNTQIKTIKEFLATWIEYNPWKFDPKDEMESTISSIPEIYDEMKLVDFFNAFLRKQNCQEYSNLLKSVNLFLLFREIDDEYKPYKALYDKITCYTVHVSDSIYYHNVNPQSMYSGKKSTVRRRKRRSKRISFMKQ